MDLDVERYRVKRGTKKSFSLDRLDPGDKYGLPDSKGTREDYVARMSLELVKLQEKLFAEGRRKVLLVLQGMDTAGKSGTIKKVFRVAHSLGLRAVAFKAPTQNELARDYLWRVHQVVPRVGEMVIFDRSHYEDVLITRVRGWIGRREEHERLHHIREFERLLVETGTTVIKCFLHISKDEQRRRLQARLDNPEKHWKMDMGDLENRALWEDFQAQYTKVIARTSTEFAPWYVVPANSKLNRNVVVLKILLDTLRSMDLQFPEVDRRSWVKEIPE